MTFIADTAIVADDVKIGEDSKIWHFVQLRDGVVIGKNCNLGNGVYIDSGVKLGDNVSIQNKTSVYRPVVIEDDVFVGPNVCFVNDKYPRSKIIRDLSGISWTIKKGASIGANSVILPDLNIGQYAMVGSGSVVTKEVPDHALVAGNPAKIFGFVCYCGKPVDNQGICSDCGKKIDLPVEY